MKISFLTRGMGLLAIACCCFGCCDGFIQDSLPRRDLIPGPGRGGGSSSAAVSDTVVYVTGIEYPDDYNWQRDSAYGSVEAKLVLFADGKRKLSLDVGDSFMVGVDADMHRVVEGRLYTDFSTADETIVKCNGQEIFRYPGREQMCGFLIRDGAVWTLGQCRSGLGFSLRCDGEAVLENDVGVVCGTMGNPAFKGGALYEDCGQLCFSYYVPVTSGGVEVGRTWHIVRDGADGLVELPSNISKVHDIRMIGGVLTMAAEASNTSVKPILVEDGRQYAVGSPSGTVTTLRNCRLCRDADGAMIKCEESYDGGKTYISSISGKSYRKVLDEYTRVFDFYIDGRDCALVASRYQDYVSLVQFRGSYALDFPVRLLSPSCAVLHGGHFYIALTPVDLSRQPCIWKDGAISPIPLHGPLTSVSVWP